MALELILGPAAGGKTTKIEQEICRIAQADVQQPVIYIVPEQTTLKVQQRILQQMQGKSMLGTEILSFNRLAHRIFSETGMPQVKLLDDMGKCMVLYKLAREHKDELIYYGSSAGQKGFIGQLKLMVTELFQYGLDDESLQKLIQQQPEDSILAAKLKDIALLWKYFKEYTGEQVIATEAVLDLLAERLERSQLIQNARVFVDDFSGFTPQQYRILTTIAIRSKGLSVALSLTPAAYKAVQSVQDWRDLPRQLFFTTGKTVWKLQKMAKEYHVPLRISWTLESFRPKELAHVTDQLCLTMPQPFEGSAKRVKAYSAANQTEELKQLFHEVMYLVRERGYRYRDIAIVAADLEGYAHPMRRQMELYEIPGFVDEKMDISLSPYVQWIQGLGELIASGFSSEALFAVLKTGLTELTAEEMDRLENQVLKENWLGRDRVLRGLREQETMWQQGQSEQLELWQGPLGRLADQLEAFAMATKGKHTVQELTEAYRLLADQQQVQKRLEEKALQLETEGKLLKAMQYSRIFDVVNQLQEELCEVMGSVSMSMSEYADVLEVGLAQSKMGQLPPAVDELLVADLGRSKLSAYKAVFIIGLQEGSFPKVGGAKGLLTQKERSMAGSQLELAQGEKENLLEQYFLLYTMMGKASERLYFFSSQGTSEGKAFGQSTLWKRLERVLGSNWKLAERPASPRPMPYLYEANGPVGGSAAKWLEENGFEKLSTLMNEGQNLKAGAQKLPTAVARRLMDPAQRMLSVTQLEQYARCPFAYYLRYGLYLKEREVPQVRSLEDGNVLHDILQDAGEFLSQALAGEEAVALAQKLADLKQEEYAVYQTTGRYRYYWRKLQRSAARALQILTMQIQKGDFEPAAFEWRFGGGSQGGEPISVTLPDGRIAKLQGKVDRVDLWQDEQERYVRVIDYKSGSTEYKPEELYAGLQLQLPVYMEATAQAYDAKPAGFFYFHLTPQVQESEGTSMDFEHLMLKAGRLDGLFLDDLSVAGHMDHEVDVDPLVIKARVTKDGRFAKNNLTASPEQFEALQEFTHKKIRQLSCDIGDGHIEQSPVKLGQNKVCDYCEFRRACPFDESLPGQECRRVEKMSAEQFWEKIEEFDK